MLKEEYKKKPVNDLMYDLDISNAVSPYEFTGVLPRPPKDEEEKENYLEVMNFSPETVDAFLQKKNSKDI